MTLCEFVEYVVSGDMTEENMVRRWKKFCVILSELPADEISEIIHDGLLDQFVDHEADDRFGTEGMKL